MEWHVCRKSISAFACMLAVGAAIQARTIRVGGESTAEYPSLRSAVEAAQSGDVIVVEEGLYSGDGNRDITVRGKAITIRGRDPNDPTIVARTTIDCRGSAAQSYRAFDICSGNGTRLVIEGLTIINGRYAMSGGAVLCEGAEFRAYNCTFSNNYIEWWGGAVHCRDSRAWFEGCTFSNNVSDGSHGAAIFCTASVLELENCAFEANRGGAIESYDSDLTLTRCAFQENTGQTGGAIHSRVDASPQSPSRLHLSRCTFVGNAADTFGGALYNYELNPTLDGCTFTANTAGKDGGAILNYRSSPVLTDCVLAGNTAVGLGGGVLSLFDSNPQIINCTFVANNADRGGALACKGQGRTLISHSVLWNNTAKRGPALHLAKHEWGGAFTASATVEYSDVEGGRDSLDLEPECTLTWSAGNIDADPLFTGPAHDDYRLSPDSPCIDAGDARYVASSDADDLDNYSRQFGVAVDLGAYEYRGLGPVYRFCSPTKDRYFYTIYGAERDRLINEFPHAWTFEDVAYYAFYQPIVENLRPVYRFWSPLLKAHLWTIHEEERQWLEQEVSNVWIFEGVAFYAFPRNLQPLGTLAVYRFWSGQLGHHFYTMDDAEKNNLIENHSGLWEFEGTAWYTYAKPHQIGKAAYAFTGGPAGAWCSLTLAASVDGQEVRITAPDVELSPATTQMQMTIDCRQLTVTLDKLSIQTQTGEHSAEIAVPGADVTIPLTLSIQTSFVLPTQRGPFAVDPTTNLFADFVDESRNLIQEDSAFSYHGSVSLAGQAMPFEHTLLATRFELQAFGSFESLGMLPDGLYARMPLTFQWHRQKTRDLLAEGSVDGRRVQIYIIYSYVGTQGLWQGKRVE